MAGSQQSVGLTVPAQADYLVLARLALSALCRLTDLRPEDAADLKLAVTEMAGAMVDGDAGPDAERLEFRFELGEESLGVSITGGAGGAEPDDELARAIVAATVDELTYEGKQVKLVKYLLPSE